MPGKYVFSTLTASHDFPQWESKRGNDQLPRAKGMIRILGGANLPAKTMVTPRGVMTPITDAQYEILQANPAFQRFVKRGFMTVEDRPHDADEVAENMTSKDGSAPSTAEDFENKGQKPPSVGTASDADTSTVDAAQRSSSEDSSESDDEESEKPPKRGRGRPRKTQAAT